MICTEVLRRYYWDVKNLKEPNNRLRKVKILLYLLLKKVVFSCHLLIIYFKTFILSDSSANERSTLVMPKPKLEEHMELERWMFCKVLLGSIFLNWNDERYLVSLVWLFECYVKNCSCKTFKHGEQCNAIGAEMFTLQNLFQRGCHDTMLSTQLLCKM